MTGRIIGTQYSQHGETLITNGKNIHIDRTYSAEEWCTRHGMRPEYTAEAGGERFTVWTGVRRYELGTVPMACAIPHKEEART